MPQPHGTAFTVYAYRNQIYLRKQQDPPFVRPILLATDFYADLSQLYLQSEFYYCYLTLSGDIMIRSLQTEEPYLCIKKEEGKELLHPQLTLFSHSLCLCYTLREAGDGGLRFCVALPDPQASSEPCRLVLLDHTLLSEQHAVLENRIRELTEILEQKDNETTGLRQSLDRAEAHLTSAKSQYAQLMDTARQYKAEAEKWYTKYRKK